MVRGAMLRATTIALALLATALAGRVGADDAAPAPVVRWKDGRVSVRAKGASRADVVATLAREAGLVVTGEVLVQRPVHKRFEDVPLPEALDRLLGGQNYALVYDDTGRPRRITLLGLPEPPAKPAVARRPPPRVPRNAATAAALSAALAQQRRLGFGRVPPWQARR
jgi:hypothetical protein